MNIILYTSDLEPITVVDLPLELLEEARNNESVRVYIKRPVSIEFIKKVAENKTNGLEYITIRCRRIITVPDATANVVYVTDDEELALSIVPEWLPGQRLQVQNYQNVISWLIRQLKRLVQKYNLDDTA